MAPGPSIGPSVCLSVSRGGMHRSQAVRRCRYDFRAFGVCIRPQIIWLSADDDDAAAAATYASNKRRSNQTPLINMDCNLCTGYEWVRAKEREREIESEGRNIVVVTNNQGGSGTAPPMMLNFVEPFTRFPPLPPPPPPPSSPTDHFIILQFVPRWSPHGHRQRLNCWAEEEGAGPMCQATTAATPIENSFHHYAYQYLDGLHTRIVL